LRQGAKTFARHLLPGKPKAKNGVEHPTRIENKVFPPAHMWAVPVCRGWSNLSTANDKLLSSRLADELGGQVLSPGSRVRVLSARLPWRT